MSDTYICVFCQQERKNANSLRNHSRLCKQNPERQNSPFLEYNSKRKPSNQFIKARELGLPIPIRSEETRRKLSIASRKNTHSVETRAKISDSIRSKVMAGEWHTSLAKSMHYNFNGIDLHGRWELNFVIFLETHNIRWIRCKERFAYQIDEIQRMYTPDFFLPDSNQYIEIKGYETEKDRAKWEQFPKDKNLLVLKKPDLQQLDII